MNETFLLDMRHFVHPPLLKFLKRDGVLYLKAKKSNGITGTAVAGLEHRLWLTYRF